MSYKNKFKNKTVSRSPSAYSLAPYLNQSLRLPSRERTQLAEYLIRSLVGEEDMETEKQWIEEAERRYREYKEGKVKTKSAELVFKEARSKFK